MTTLLKNILIVNVFATLTIGEELCTTTVSSIPKNNTIVNSSVDLRIVGGRYVSKGVYPYQVSIRNFKRRHLCGGSIIKRTIILTAAHCFYGTTLKASQFLVVVGSNKLNSGGTTYAVRDIIVHSSYNHFTHRNDIALLKLSSPIRYSKYVSRIKLETSKVNPGTRAVLTGWGATSYPGFIFNTLQYISVKTISNCKCQLLHGIFRRIYRSQICTPTINGKGACIGDSGGPLVANGRQIGIVSWGNACATGYPDVFTRVSSYEKWIKRNF